MPPKQGLLVLMGSGELTGTMVEVHKALLRRYGRDGLAVFIDTPAGFQLNVDHIAERARDYFRTRVQHPLEVASCKSANACRGPEGVQAMGKLSRADYIFIGPGSPSYALKQWQDSPVPGLMIERVEAGGCLVAASAAALTVGRFTLPVYEIYKVGQELHWMDGLGILSHFGFDVVVVPHWNNAEGGNHDTRFCFMGAPRFERLEAMLPEETTILGLDEHTALIIDFASQTADIEGAGRITLRRNGRERVFSKETPISLDLLRGAFEAGAGPPAAPPPRQPPQIPAQPTALDKFWQRLHELETDFKEDLETEKSPKAAGILLEVERLIWQNQGLLQENDGLGAARELMRELLVLLSARLSALPPFSPLVRALLDARAGLREQKQWGAADAIRDSLYKAGIVVEDSGDGPSWYFEHR